MPLNMPYDKYMENAILTASSEELTLMLYNGLVRFILQAQLAIERQEMEKAHGCIVKAKKILLSLENTLDMRYEISQGLRMIYEYLYKRLTDANVKKDRAVLEEVLGFAKEMKDTWSQAMKIAKCRDKASSKKPGPYR